MSAALEGWELWSCFPLVGEGATSKGAAAGMVSFVGSGAVTPLLSAAPARVAKGGVGREGWDSTGIAWAISTATTGAGAGAEAGDIL